MIKQLLFLLFWVVGVCLAPFTVSSAWTQGYDIRGGWVGNAKGKIFGAEGSVYITRQERDEIYGTVEGGNFFGKGICHSRAADNGKQHLDQASSQFLMVRS